MKIDKIKEWIKDKHNLIFLAVLFLGIIIRLYYLIITKNQPLWWDEAEYLLMAKYFATGDLFMNLFASRPLLLPLFFAFLMKINLGYEIIYRIIEVIISSIGLLFVYLTAKELFNKETGIISTLFLSVFYLHIFYTSRILLDSIAPTFWVLSVYFFTKGYIKKKENKSFYLSAFFGALGVFLYNQTIALFIIYLVFLLITEKLNLFKEKRFYIFGLIAFITFLPTFILNKILYNNTIEFIKKGISTGDVLTANYPENILTFIKYLPAYLDALLLIIFIFSVIIVFYKLIIGIDLVIKTPDQETKKLLFLFLWLVLSFLIIIKIVGHFEDRYIMPTFIPLFIITALGIYKLKEYLIKITDKRIVFAIIIILLLLISFTQIKKADNAINGKKDSFLQLKQASLWIKENSNPGDRLLTSSSPMTLYYSERKIVNLPEK